ncbi:hypothetical protein CEW46_21145 [Bacillus cereus]|nr:hypothetical protein CEW46_21145 [Bacillus cereus]
MLKMSDIVQGSQVELAETFAMYPEGYPPISEGERFLVKVVDHKYNELYLEPISETVKHIHLDHVQGDDVPIVASVHPDCELYLPLRPVK